MMHVLQANDLAGYATVKELKWASDVEHLSPPFDVIIASDLLYDMKAIPELLLTIVSLSSSDTITYLAFELRPNVIRAAFQAMEAYGLKAEQVRAAMALFSALCLPAFFWLVLSNNKSHSLVWHKLLWCMNASCHDYCLACSVCAGIAVTATPRLAE